MKSPMDAADPAETDAQNARRILSATQDQLGDHPLVVSDSAWVVESDATFDDDGNLVSELTHFAVGCRVHADAAAHNLIEFEKEVGNADMFVLSRSVTTEETPPDGRVAPVAEYKIEVDVSSDVWDEEPVPA